MRKLFCLAALALSLKPLWAEPPKVGILFVDNQGHWDSLNTGETAVEGGVTDARLLLRSDIIKRLSFEQRQDLLHEPERLLSCTRVRELLTTPRILLLFPEKDGRTMAAYYDLESHVRELLVAEPDQSPSEARQQLVKLAQKEYGPHSLPVLANTQSRRYHLRHATHVNTDGTLLEMPSSYLAEAQGYQACDICFDAVSRPSTLDQDDLERTLGQTLAHQVESQFRLCQDPSAIERVTRVGKRLLAGNQLDHNYRFIVLESEKINAFAVPTGPLYVTTGLLNVVESDDELSGVMGHELAHSELHHGRRQYEQAQQWSWLALLTGIATRNAWLYNAAQMFGNVLTRGYSRDFELEADRQGVWYSYGAGFRADHFKLTLQKFLDLEQKRGGGGFSWLRTHPGSDQRLQEINDILGRVEPLGLLLEEVEPVDPGLARHLQRKGEQFLEDPQEVVRFYTAYRHLSWP
ncbi:M48 family metalloprotease [bacterium]|nr:M48 family metalloprotease [bacterium]